MKTIISPLVEEQMKLIRDMENLKECLEVRLALLGQEYALKTEYERNEIDILRMKTEIQLNKLDSQLIDKKQDFERKIKGYFEELEELGIEEDK